MTLPYIFVAIYLFLPSMSSFTQINICTIYRISQRIFILSLRVTIPYDLLSVSLGHLSLPLFTSLVYALRLIFSLVIVHIYRTVPLYLLPF